MKISELREELEKFDGDEEIYAICEAGEFLAFDKLFHPRRFDAYKISDRFYNAEPFGKERHNIVVLMPEDFI